MAEKASPQVENGYIRIANELFVALMGAKFTASERRCIDLVLRLSYGCGKKSAQFRFWSDFEVASILKQNVKSVVGDLETKHIFKIDWEAKEISLNKNYLKWDVEMADSTRKMDKLLSINLQKSNAQITNGHTESNSHITFQGNEESKSNPPITQKVIPTLPKSNPHITTTPPKPTDTNGSQPPKDSKDSYKEKEEEVDNTIQPNNTSKELATLPPPSSSEDRILENGMTWPELRYMLQHIKNAQGYEKIGVLDNLSMGENASKLRYIETQPKERIEEVIAMEAIQDAPPRYVLERIYERLEQYDYEQSKKPPPPKTLQQRLGAEIARLDDYQKQVDSAPRNATDPLCIKTLAQMQSHINDLKEEIQNAGTATAG